MKTLRKARAAIGGVELMRQMIKGGHTVTVGRVRLNEYTISKCQFELLTSSLEHYCLFLNEATCQLCIHKSS